MIATKAGRGVRRTGLERIEARQGLLAVLPVIVLLVLIRGYPLVLTLIKSFTNWDGLNKDAFVGLLNYERIFTGGDLLVMCRNSLLYSLHIPVLFVFGLIIAVMLYDKVPGWKVFRVLLYVPCIVSAVAIGTLFRRFFAFDGPINQFLRAMGLELFAVEWMADAYPAIFVIVVTLIWQSLGWQVLIILGGLASIDPSVLEAATIDGVNQRQRMFQIILPLLYHVIQYCVLVGIIWVFNGLFPLIYSMSKGGPGNATITFDYLIYKKAFQSAQMGSACAVSMLLLVIVVAITLVQNRLTREVE